MAKKIQTMAKATILNNHSDEELIGLVADEREALKRKAFSILVARHTRYFYNIAYRITLEKEAAEDVVQSSFLKLWQNPNLWEADKAKFKTWFYRIVCNAAIDHKRRLKPAEQIDNLEIEDENSADIEKNDEQRILHNALSQIPPRQRAAIMMVYFEEMKQQEAADILEIGIKALESLLSRGKKALEDILK